MKQITVLITQGALNNSYLKIGPLNRDFFPVDAFGASNVTQGAGKLLSLHVAGINEIVETDIAEDKLAFRKRPWKAFYEHYKIRPGDEIIIEKVSDFVYRVYPHAASH